MRKTYKYALIIAGSVLALLAGAAAFFAASFDPNDYKPQLIRLVQEKTQRRLDIPGEIKLAFFPRLGAEVGTLRLSEHNSTAEFASVQGARVSLALVPLLSRQLVVDQVVIDGLRLTLRRDKDGSTNVDDLLKKEEQPAAQEKAPGEGFRFDIEGIRLKQAQVNVEDRLQARTLSVAGLDLETGRIAPGTPGHLKLAGHVKANQPQVDADVSLKTAFTFTIDRKQVALKGLDAAVKGALAGFTGLDLTLAGNADLMPEVKRFRLDGIRLDAKGTRDGEAFVAKLEVPGLSVTDTTVSGGKLRGEARLGAGSRNMTATLSVPSFEGRPSAFSIPVVSMDGRVQDGALDAKVQLSGAVQGNIDKLLFTSPQLNFGLDGRQGSTAIKGKLSSPVTLDLASRRLELQKLTAGFDLPNPAGGVLALKASGNAAMDLGKKSGSALLNGSIDQSAFRARLGLAGSSPKRHTFDIGVDQLDLDRYRAKAAAQSPAKGQAAEQPMDFAALRNLHASGSAHIGTLKAANIRTANVRFDMRASNGRLDIAPLSANLYGGNVAGSLSVVAGKPVRIAVQQKFTGVDIGPLMKDAIDKDTLEGKGNVQLDVTTTGATFTQMKQGLNGSARLELRDGAIRGVNIAQTIRDAKARIGQLRGDEKPQGGVGSAAQKTDFSELSGSFRVVNGVAHNEDLIVKSPLVRVAGSGDIHLPESRLDYLARTTIVSTLQGQGGPELQSLKGLTVPVRLSGPFNAIGWRVDLAGMASELARQKLDERKEEVRAKAEKSLDEQKEKIRGQLQERLKGLLGR